MIPKFSNENEEVEFWRTHDMVDFLDDLVPIDVKFVRKEDIAKVENNDIIWTKEKLEHLRQKRQEEFRNTSYYASQPQPLFIDERFNPDNWNGGDDVIRGILRDLYWNHYVTELDDVNRKDTDFVVYISSFSHDDYTLYTIITKEVDLYGYVDVHSYVVWWYKNRGNTEGLVKDGRYMTEDEYVHLLNILTRVMQTVE